MNSKKFEAWIAKLSTEEKDKPVLALSGKTYSPNQILKEINSDSENGKQLLKGLKHLP